MCGNVQLLVAISFHHRITIAYKPEKAINIKALLVTDI